MVSIFYKNIEQKYRRIEFIGKLHYMQQRIIQPVTLRFRNLIHFIDEFQNYSLQIQFHYNSTIEGLKNCSDINIFTYFS